MDGKKRDDAGVENYRKMHCPLVEKPLPRCHCHTPKSMNIYSIIHYCGNNFGECQIYQNRLKEIEEQVIAHPEKDQGEE